MFVARLLGGVEFEDEGRVLAAIKTHHFEALIGGLLLEPGRRLSRAELGQRFWPAQDESARRRNLRQLLYRLRQGWPGSDRCLRIDREMLSWSPDVPLTVDLDEVEGLLGRPLSEAALSRLFDLCRGGLMPSHRERWILPRRRDFDQRVSRYLQRASTWAASNGLQRSWIRCLEALVELIPDQAEPWVELADAYVSLGMLDKLEEARERHSRLAQAAHHASIGNTADIFDPHRLVAKPLPPVTRALQGREECLAELVASWDEARLGAPTAALIEGGPGMGKSAVAEALATHVEQQGGVVVRLSCYEATTSCPWFIAEEALRQLLQSSGLGEARAARSRPSAGAQGDLPPPRLTARPLVDAIEAELSVRPAALLVLDDCHRCDPDSLRALATLLLRRGATMRMLVLTANPMEVGSRDPVVTACTEELLRSLRGLTLPLRPLSPAAARALISAHLKRPVSADAVSRTLEAAGGVPALLIDACRWLNGEEPSRQAGHLRRLQALLGRLSINAREVARAAAALGERFSFDELRRAAQERVDVVAGLDSLVESGWLVEGSRGELSFESPAHHEAAHSTVRGYHLQAMGLPASGRGSRERPVGAPPLALFGISQGGGPVTSGVTGAPGI